jgi:hypothetical protein
MGWRSIGWLFVCLTLSEPALSRAEAGQPEQTPRPTEAQAQKTPPAGDPVVSMDRIKEQLGRDQPLKIDLNQPVFRVDIIGRHRPLLKDFVEGLKFDWEPIPAGGRDYYEFMTMVTPPQARPYGAFVNGELAQVAATSFANALLQTGLFRAVNIARDAWRERQEEQARELVRRELEAYLQAHPEAARPIRW